jgi:hypothetical protein
MQLASRWPAPSPSAGDLASPPSSGSIHAVDWEAVRRADAAEVRAWWQWCGRVGGCGLSWTAATACVRA